MNEDFHSTSTSTVTVGVSAPYPGAFFPRSRNLVIAGGVFTSNVKNIRNCPPAVPCDFRRIPLGDLDLRHEIRFECGSDTACHRNCGGSARKFYSARIHDCNANLTAAVYQGETAEEDLRDTVLKYSWLRHPNVVQLFGTVTTSGIHAAVYHDEIWCLPNKCWSIIANPTYGVSFSGGIWYIVLTWNSRTPVITSVLFFAGLRTPGIARSGYDLQQAESPLNSPLRPMSSTFYKGRYTGAPGDLHSMTRLKSLASPEAIFPVGIIVGRERDILWSLGRMVGLGERAALADFGS
ncbi:hypothetical protein K438DRAFT_1979948 [Mycena galopus ATCC 62051]|nr:hypothetical protein K438DRAFT_1979948 [Mycena galopus ATCC 62051]